MMKVNSLEEALKEHDLHYFRHTYYVVLAWLAIRDYLISAQAVNEDEIKKINQLIAWHDNSKIMPEERIGYSKKFYLCDETEQAKEEWKLAVKHHKDNNLHHFESLKNYNGEYWKCYVIEMICDYTAMGWEFKNYLFEYYEANCDRINIPQEYKKYLEYILSIIKNNCYEIVEKPMTYELESRIESHIFTQE